MIDGRGISSPTRSLSDYLAELLERFDAAAMTDPERGALERRIVIVEAELMAREQ